MKKINIIIILILLITFSMIIVPNKEYATQTINKTGDINSDGMIDSRDILRILKHIAASTVTDIKKKHPDWILKEDNFKAGDINNDEVIDSRDTLKILEYTAALTIPKIANKHPEWKNNLVFKPNSKIDDIKLNETKVTINIGQVYKLKAIIVPTNTANKTITWTSSDTKVATVDGLGNVEGKSAGITIIKATASNGKEVTCRITVKPTEEKQIRITSIVLKEKDRTINVGASLQLHATITPANATNKTIIWTTSDRSIATVSNSGLVKGIKAGKVTIIASTSNKKKTTCIIRVNVPAKSISLNKTNITLNEGNSTKLTVNFNPTNTSSKTITWKSSNTKVVTVNNKGEIKAIKKGSAKITATSTYGKIAKCTVKVTEKQTFDLQHAINVSSEPHAKDHENLPWHGSTVGKHAGMIGAYVEAINILNGTNYRLKEVYKKIISAHPKQKSSNEPVYENEDINAYYNIKVSRASASVKEIKKALEKGKLVAEIVNTTKWRDEKGNLFGKTGRHTGLIFYYDGKYYHMKTSVKKNAIYTESQLKEWLGNTSTKLIIYSKK